ncbi:MAG: methionine synthase [Prevotella sp.]|nr:methionine synthase [Prevotella sp.]
MRKTRQDILAMMRERILILDGATGTYLQGLNLTEEDFRGERFKDHFTPLKGCNDVLCLTKPEAVIGMHRAYIEAGADIIETNSFNGNCFSLSDYGLEDYVYEINRAAAECANSARERNATCGDYENEASPAATTKTILIAGSMGPTSKTTSISADVNDPGAREVTFMQLYDTYREQARGLIDGGADILLVETVFDTLNAKAALKAITDLGEQMGIDIPIMVSGTLSDASGRTLSGQTVEAYYASLSHANLLSIGLNCGFGAKQLLPWLKRLADIADCAVSVHPNAGLPNVMGGYDETPETFSAVAKEVFASRMVNIYGGCCGTTPEHIRSLKITLTGTDTFLPRPLPTPKPIKPMRLSGLEELVIDHSFFVNVGERTNVAGSAKFKKLIQAKDYEAALSVARQQVENGAQVIDVCMDDGLIDGVEAMTTFLNLIASEPEIARVPIMIDSSKWEILKAGLQCVQGKSIVNSISLKEGEEKFLEKAKYIHAIGAATVVMLFDEEGQADTYERKVTVARRAYRLLKGIGFPTEDIIFDPNVLAVATGMPEHDDYARAFIEACRTIHEEMPEVHMSGGISNLSFSFRGNNTIRQAMHSVFLYHAMQAGLDMSIVNPAMTTIYSDIPKDMLKVVEDVILNTDNGAAERLIDFAERVKAEQTNEPQHAISSPAGGGREGASAKDRIALAMLKGLTDNIEADTEEAYKEAGTALGVIDDYLMPAMEQVGKLFGEGKMFLPQVVKSARVMKKAVAVLEPYMKTPSQPPQGEGDIHPPVGRDGVGSSGKVLMATVKGDVHDIGKNIVCVVTQCNGYDVEDLGVMVDTETIVDAAEKHGVDVIGLSGLITPSLDEMIKVVQELQRRGMKTPVIVGGATTSALHTAVKMAPEYPDGVVIHSHSAADNATIIRRLLADDREEYIAEQRNQQRIVRENYLSKKAQEKAPLSLADARQRRHVKRVGEVAIPKGDTVYDLHVGVKDIEDRINWNFFFQAWGMKGEDRKGEEAQKLMHDAHEMLKVIDENITLLAKAQILPANSNEYDDIVINGNGNGNRDKYIINMPRSRNEDGETMCLADYIMQEGVDFICPFVVSAGVGLRTLQEEFRKDKDEYKAMLAKLLCDRLAEALADYLSDALQWGDRRIRFAFGYGACPDHKPKEQIFDILGVGEKDGLTLTETYMINPGESICGLFFANTPTKYFNV